MRVLIVAKTRRGGGACVGGITWEGRSVRLVAADAASNARAGLEYQVGELWEIQAACDHGIVPPHVENVLVLSARPSGVMSDPEAFIQRHMPPALGGPEVLFEGLTKTSAAGGLYISQGQKLPSRSTMFWRPDKPLAIDTEGKRIRYRYPNQDGGRTLTFVGFQEPVQVLPAGTLLRISLAHWWRPKDRPEEDLRCYLQLSGWFGDRRAPTEQDANSGRPAVIGPRCYPPPSVEAARDTLKRHFGFSDFLPTQREVIARVLNGLDTLAVMPTGGGKSLCYQLPALLFKGLTVVVSPLIALMQDQVTQLHELGISAAFLNSTVPLPEYIDIAARVRNGEIRILYAAPETLVRPETLLLVAQSGLSCLAVDEAHCISEWGHDFRPEYRELQTLRRRFNAAVCLALTATATPRVREDIRRILQIEAAGDFVASFNRPNLLLHVHPRQDGFQQCLRFLEEHRDQSGIIYCATREQVDRLAFDLHARGWPALPYHAGLEDGVRRRNQVQFIHDDVSIMVATVAFGMGINKANVRFVLHYRLPKDMESYYQEIGRAGRDGLPAHCLLLHSRTDATTIRRFIDQGAASERTGRLARLEAMLRYAEASGCRSGPLLGYFGESSNAECGHCDYCLSLRDPAQSLDVTESAHKFLSCVQQTGGVFGPAYIIELLRGSRSAKVLARGHHLLSTHATGRVLSPAAWTDLAHLFVQRGLLERDLQLGTLQLSPSGRKVLQGERVFAKPQPGLGGIARMSNQPSEHDGPLFDKLRALRRRLAEEAQVPSYLIFSDRTLLEMATFKPQTETELLAVNGVGEVKLAKYGAGFLKLLRENSRSAGS